MDTLLSAIWKSLLVGAAVLVWIVVLPLLDALLDRPEQERDQGGRPTRDVAPARSLEQAA